MGVRVRVRVATVDLSELRGNFGSEEPARPSRADGPGLDVVRVGPHQVTEGALVRDLLLGVRVRGRGGVGLGVGLG